MDLIACRFTNAQTALAYLRSVGCVIRSPIHRPEYLDRSMNRRVLLLVTGVAVILAKQLMAAPPANAAMPAAVKPTELTFRAGGLVGLCDVAQSDRPVMGAFKWSSCHRNTRVSPPYRTSAPCENVQTAGDARHSINPLPFSNAESEFLPAPAEDS